MNADMIVAICYYVVFIAQFWIMWKEKNPRENEIFAVTIPDAVMENEEIGRVRKRYSNSLILVAILVAVLPLSLFLMKWMTVQVLVWMILFVLMAVLSFLPYWVANQRVKKLKEENHYMEQAPGLTEIDANWKHGIFYYNPEDERLTGEKKIGIGTCINHARPMGKFLTGLAWVAIVALLIFGVYLVRVQSTPLSLSYEDGVLNSGQMRTNYSLDVDVMQMVMLLDEMPKGNRVIGTGFDNLQRGIYDLEGFGNCKVNVNPQNHAFILIYAEDGFYIFSGDTDKKTKEIYEDLKEEL